MRPIFPLVVVIMALAVCSRQSPLKPIHSNRRRAPMSGAPAGLARVALTVKQRSSKQQSSLRRANVQNGDGVAVSVPPLRLSVDLNGGGDTSQRTTTRKRREETGL